MERVELEPYLTDFEIKNIVYNLAKKIRLDYSDKNPLLVCVLNGAIQFTADLSRAINIPLEIDSMRVRSYKGTKSSGHPVITKDIEISPTGRHVIVVEDIVDTSQTMDVIFARIEAGNPASLECCTLLLRNGSLMMPKYFGRIVGDGFVAGYGLDVDQAYRELPDIGFLPGTR